MATTLLGSFFIALGVAAWATAVVAVLRTAATRRRHRSWTPTTARIDDVTTYVERSTESMPHTRYVAHYSYRAADGTEHRGSQTVRNQRIRKDAVGGPLAIVVDPRDPGRSLVAGETPALGCAIVGMALPAVIGVVFVWAGTGIVRGTL